MTGSDDFSRLPQIFLANIYHVERSMIGQTINSYRIIEEVAAGGFGTLYNAPLIIEIKHIGLTYLECLIALNIRVNNCLYAYFR